MFVCFFNPLRVFSGYLNLFALIIYLIICHHYHLVSFLLSVHCISLLFPWYSIFCCWPTSALLTLWGGSLGLTWCYVGSGAAQTCCQFLGNGAGWDPEGRKGILILEICIYSCQWNSYPFWVDRLQCICLASQGLLGLLKWWWCMGISVLVFLLAGASPGS